MFQSVKCSQGDLAILRAHPIFAQLPQELFDEVGKSCRAIAVKKNQFVFHAGDRGDEFYVIAEGAVRLLQTDTTGEEATLSLMQKGQSFAEAAMFLGQVFPATAMAIENCRLIRVKAATIRDLIGREPRFAFGFLAAFSGHLKQLVDEISLLRKPTARLKLIEFMLRQTEQTGGAVALELPYSKVNIARRLGISPEMLSRTFAGLRSVGVTVEGRNVTIADVGKLHMINR